MTRTTCTENGVAEYRITGKSSGEIKRLENVLVRNPVYEYDPGADVSQLSFIARAFGQYSIAPSETNTLYFAHGGE